jgi:hypothetical protein
VTIGDVAGDHINTIYTDVNRFSLYLFIVLAVVAAAYVTWRVLRRRRGAGQPGRPEAQPGAKTETPKTETPKTETPETETAKTVESSKPQGS